jgi:hypothetical protein
MTPSALSSWLSKAGDITPAEAAAIKSVNDRVPGWSGFPQWRLFAGLLSLGARDFLICGVYQGRDICYILELHKTICPDENIKIVGVDLFSPEPCADWPEEKLGMTWEQAGMGMAPSVDAAVENTDASRIESADVTFCIGSSFNALGFWPMPPKDVIYLDTSHDYDTVRREIELARPLLAPGGILCGDDYRGQPHWGVEKACRELLKPHYTFAGMVWFAGMEEEAKP